MCEHTGEHELGVRCQAAGPSHIVDGKYFCIANLPVTFYVHFMFLYPSQELDKSQPKKEEVCVAHGWRDTGQYDEQT